MREEGGGVGGGRGPRSIGAAPLREFNNKAWTSRRTTITHPTSSRHPRNVYKQSQLFSSVHRCGAFVFLKLLLLLLLIRCANQIGSSPLKIKSAKVGLVKTATGGR
jgi:hypothetical protein